MESTVTEEEIQVCLERAAEIEKQLKEDKENQVETQYLIYRKTEATQGQVILKG